MFRFHKTYFFLTVLLFITEVLIAVFLHDGFVRPYVGDFLVVILLYCFARGFFRIPVYAACLAVLLFSFCIELAQYFHLVHLLRLEENKTVRTILGQSFEWADLLAYTLGILCVWLTETYREKTLRFSEDNQ